MIATTPIVAPIVAALGYDLVWFGVLFMILIEAALITPPIGVNLFVVQSVRTGSHAGPIRDVMIGVTPFLFMMLTIIGGATGFSGFGAVAADAGHAMNSKPTRRMTMKQTYLSIAALAAAALVGSNALAETTVNVVGNLGITTQSKTLEAPFWNEKNKCRFKRRDYSPVSTLERNGIERTGDFSPFGTGRHERSNGTARAQRG